MRRGVVFAVVLIFAAWGAYGARRPKLGAVDWIFLLDTSKSMRGVGKGARNIFPEVKASIESFVREAQDGDSVTIQTFDSDVRSYGLRDIHGPFDREELYDTIRQLQAEGNRTHLGLAIAKGLERSEALMQRDADATRARAIVLFTDGKEDVKGIANPVPIPANVARTLASKPWIFFVSMGEHEAQLDDFAAAAARTQVLKAPDTAAIRAVAGQIRKLVRVPVPAPRTPRVQVTPATIDFGKLKQGATSEERDLTITSDRPVRLSASLEEAAGVSMAPQDNVAVDPAAPARLKIRLTVADDGPPGERRLMVRVGEKRAVSALVSVYRPSPLIRAAKWAAAVLVFLLLAIAGLVLYSGKMPGELLASLTERNTLEGEIEIVTPRVAADAAFVGLPALRKNEVALSAIVPPDALSGSDARLFVRRSGSEKKVWIAASSGALRVNDIEVPTAELYDADTIRIGAAKLRFNRLGHERPTGADS